MTTSTLSSKIVDAGRLRPLNIFTDLPPVADMIETCFAGLLDQDGLAAVNNIRRQGKDKGFLSWAPRMVDTISLPLSGFVYEADGKLVGNVSIIPYNRFGERNYLIANVATLPQYRRRGIARLLTEAAVAKAYERGAQSVWLQVRQDNPGAIGLYEQLGFVQRFTNNTWHLPPEYKITAEPDPTVLVRRAQLAEWPTLLGAYRQIYPPVLSWYYGYNLEAFKPGFWRDVQRLFKDERVVLYTAFLGGQPAGSIAVRNMLGQPEHIYAIRPFANGKAVLLALLASIRAEIDPHKKQVFEFPPSEYDELIFTAGFVRQRTLVWMQYQGAGKAATHNAAERVQE